ncbi:MAG: YHYH protein [Bacteroidia bacterium]
MDLNISKLTLALGLATCLFGCNREETTDTAAGTAPVPTVFSSNFLGAVTLSSDGTTLTVSSNGTPQHVTPYYGSGHPLYEAQMAGHTVNPGTLQAQTFVMSIPISPAEAAVKEVTALGPIGMALNGVAIYNNQEGPNIPLDSNVILSFDRGGAHSGPGGLYHYHVNGDFTSLDDANLIGWLRDGFPIYGRKDADGSYPTDLDANGGHVGTTAHYPNGIYHYHCSNVNYLNTGVYVLKSGSYHGTKGAFTF